MYQQENKLFYSHVEAIIITHQSLNKWLSNESVGEMSRLTFCQLTSWCDESVLL